jgi:mono/diheme cytochrome c family protein
MKTNVQIIVWVSACAMVAAGCASTGKLAKEQAGYPKEQLDARGLFVENCAKCHGEDGRAKTFRGKLAGAQDFTDAKWRTDTSNDDIVHAIKNGHDKMPAFEDKLSETEIAALADYVKTFHPME